MGTQDHICGKCGISLADRGKRRARYEVVGGTPIFGFVSNEPIRPWSPMWWRSFIAKHWRGELALDTSFWGATAIIVLSIYALSPAIMASILVVRSDFYIYRAMSVVSDVIWISWLSLVPIAIWQIVGTWRSAGRWRRESPRPAWGDLARLLLPLYAVLVGYLAVRAFYELWL